MKCKIYFIQCLETGEIYIGSTKQRLLCQRLAGHKQKRDCSATQILDRGNYICDILEEVEECDRYTREQYYIDTTECINKYKANTGLNKKEYHKKYQLDNKDKIKEYKSQKYTCECGQVLTISAKSKHLKTKKHQDYLKSSC